MLKCENEYAVRVWYFQIIYVDVFRVYMVLKKIAAISNNPEVDEPLAQSFNFRSFAHDMRFSEL